MYTFLQYNWVTYGEKRWLEFETAKFIYYFFYIYFILKVDLRQKNVDRRTDSSLLLGFYNVIGGGGVNCHS